MKRGLKNRRYKKRKLVGYYFVEACACDNCGSYQQYKVWANNARDATKRLGHGCPKCEAGYVAGFDYCPWDMRNSFLTDWSGNFLTVDEDRVWIVEKDDLDPREMLSNEAMNGDEWNEW